MYRYINVTSKSSLPGLVGHGYTQGRHLFLGKFKQFLAVLNHYFYTPVLPFPYPDRNHVWNIHLHLLNSVANFWANVSKYFIHHLGSRKSRYHKGSFSLFPISLVQPKTKSKPPKTWSQNDPRIYRWTQSNKMELLPWRRVWWTIGHLLGFLDEKNYPSDPRSKTSTKLIFIRIFANQQVLWKFNIKE